MDQQMHTEIRAAMDIIRNEADEVLGGLVETLVADGAARWILDPQVFGVVGLVDKDTEEALLVVYADGDWEISEVLDEMTWGE